jgi:hypothetical protein
MESDYQQVQGFVHHTKCSKMCFGDVVQLCDVLKTIAHFKWVNCVV